MINLKGADKEVDPDALTEELKKDPSDRGYEMGNVLMAANLKIPRLIAMERDAIRIFMKN